MGYSPWGRKESDRTERLTLSLSIHTFLLSLNHGKGQMTRFQNFTQISEEQDERGRGCMVELDSSYTCIFL